MRANLLTFTLVQGDFIWICLPKVRSLVVLWSLEGPRAPVSVGQGGETGFFGGRKCGVNQGASRLARGSKPAQFSPSAQPTGKAPGDIDREDTMLDTTPNARIAAFLGKFD